MPGSHQGRQEYNTAQGLDAFFTCDAASVNDSTLQLHFPQSWSLNSNVNCEPLSPKSKSNSHPSWPSEYHCLDFHTLRIYNLPSHMHIDKQTRPFPSHLQHALPRLELLAAFSQFSQDPAKGRICSPPHFKLTGACDSPCDPRSP